jgi:hypothetical protein
VEEWPGLGVDRIKDTRPEGQVAVESVWVSGCYGQQVDEMISRSRHEPGTPSVAATTVTRFRSQRQGLERLAQVRRGVPKTAEVVRQLAGLEDLLPWCRDARTRGRCRTICPLTPNEHSHDQQIVLPEAGLVLNVILEKRAGLSVR